MATVVALPRTVREKLGEDGAKDLTEFLHVSMDQRREEIVKEEFHEREKLELRLEKRLYETESRLLNKIEAVRSELKIDIEKTKGDIIKWMFIFWTGTVITILGGLFGFLKLFLGK